MPLRVMNVNDKVINTLQSHTKLSTTVPSMRLTCCLRLHPARTWELGESARGSPFPSGSPKGYSSPPVQKGEGTEIKASRLPCARPPGFGLLPHTSVSCSHPCRPTPPEWPSPSSSLPSTRGTGCFLLLWSRQHCQMPPRSSWDKGCPGSCCPVDPTHRSHLPSYGVFWDPHLRLTSGALAQGHRLVALYITDDNVGWFN